jgi:hypothetical protein
MRVGKNQNLIPGEVGVTVKHVELLVQLRQNIDVTPSDLTNERRVKESIPYPSISP